MAVVSFASLSVLTPTGVPGSPTVRVLHECLFLPDNGELKLTRLHVGDIDNRPGRTILQHNTVRPIGARY